MAGMNYIFGIIILLIAALMLTLAEIVR